MLDDGKVWLLKKNYRWNFFVKDFAEILAMITIIFLMLILLNNQQQTIVASLGFYIYAFYRAFPSMQSIFTAFVSIKGWTKVLDNVYEKINDNQKNYLVMTK